MLHRTSAWLVKIKSIYLPLLSRPLDLSFSFDVCGFLLLFLFWILSERNGCCWSVGYPHWRILGAASSSFRMNLNKSKREFRIVSLSVQRKNLKLVLSILLSRTFARTKTWTINWWIWNLHSTMCHKINFFSLVVNNVLDFLLPLGIFLVLPVIASFVFVLRLSSYFYFPPLFCDVSFSLRIIFYKKKIYFFYLIKSGGGMSRCSPDKTA